MDHIKGESMKNLLMHGPNLNLLGKRNLNIMGITLKHLEYLTIKKPKFNYEIILYQSYEGF